VWVAVSAILLIYGFWVHRMKRKEVDDEKILDDYNWAYRLQFFYDVS
jgi:hypothetical protein